MNTSPTPQPLTPQQAAILRLLYEYGHLDTHTIHQTIAPDVTERAVRLALNRLEKRELLMCYRHAATQTIYRVTAIGCQAIGQKIQRRHYRMPSRETFTYRVVEARLANHAKRLGFVVYRGTSASPLSAVKALQNETRQIVVKHWRAREKAAIAVAEAAGQWVAPRRTNLDAGFNPIPLVFREWYIHRPSVTGFIALVARREASQDYWKARIADMREVGTLLPVVCVFADSPPADLRADLQRVGFQVVEIERIGTFFESFGAT